MESSMTAEGGSRVHCTFCGKRVENFMTVCGCPGSVEANKMNAKVTSHYPQNSGGVSGKIDYSGAIENGPPIQEQVKDKVISKLQKVLEHEVRQMVDTVIQESLSDIRKNMNVVLITKDGENFLVRFEWATDNGTDNSTT